MIKIVGVNLKGLPCGEDSHLARYPDSMVAEAKALRAQGLTMRAIAARLGPTHATVVFWLNGRRRKPPVKFVAKRIKSPNHSL